MSHNRMEESNGRSHYTLGPSVARETSVQRHKWRKLEKAACALEILAMISLVMFPFVLMQLPR